MTRHSRESGNPFNAPVRTWIPAFAEMTDRGGDDGPYETVRVFLRRKSMSMNCPSVIVLVK